MAGAFVFAHTAHSGSEAARDLMECTHRFRWRYPSSTRFTPSALLALLNIEAILFRMGTPIAKVSLNYRQRSKPGQRTIRHVTTRANGINERCTHDFRHGLAMRYETDVGLKLH
jgi:hypothetical protein